MIRANRKRLSEFHFLFSSVSTAYPVIHSHAVCPINVWLASHTIGISYGSRDLRILNARESTVRSGSAGLTRSWMGLPFKNSAGGRTQVNWIRHASHVIWRDDLAPMLIAVTDSWSRRTLRKEERPVARIWIAYYYVLICWIWSPEHSSAAAIFSAFQSDLPRLSYVTATFFRGNLKIEISQVIL